MIANKIPFSLGVDRNRRLSTMYSDKCPTKITKYYVPYELISENVSTHATTVAELYD